MKLAEDNFSASSGSTSSGTVTPLTSTGDVSEQIEDNFIDFCLKQGGIFNDKTNVCTK